MADDVTNGLTPQQLEALTEVQTVTQAANPRREVEELRKANWNVQAALQAIFDDAPSQTVPSAPAAGSSNVTASGIEQMELDDTMQGSSSRRAPASAYPSTPQPGLNLFRFFAYPFSVTLSLFSFVLRIVGFPLRLLGIPLPRLPPISRAGSLTFFSRPGTSTDDPREAAMRWVRQLEEETGALCVGHEKDARSDGEDESGKGKESVKGGSLPNFMIGSYEDALRRAQRELRVLCVVLVSEEHDDVAQFKRTVLANENVVNALTEHNFIVWGGDIRDRDAYQASLKLAATTYPFIAFVSLQPPPSSRSSSSTASQLSVVSRLNPLSPAALLTHISHTVTPRTQPFLQRLKTAEAQRVRERQLRAEQDRAFEEAMKRDGERIRAAREREREAIAREAAEAERVRLKREESERRERKKMDKEAWRRYARRTLVPAEPAGQGVRVTVRISSGQRRTRTFPTSTPVEAIYAWVETLSIPPDQGAGEDPDAPPSGYGYEWDFVLATTFPRVVVPCRVDVKVGEVEVLRGGVVLVVEGTGEDAEDDEEEESEDDEE
ncbi:hypothetical protein FRC12_010111 [Ceratobasidium sp. 428]|nr:hypothetical protein FRC12_010111 [Ceratobasidium sp. 428]